MEHRNNLDLFQSLMRDDPLNEELFTEMNEVRVRLDEWINIEEQILKQKAKVQWLKCGDGNNKFFYACLRSRNNHGLFSLCRQDGTKLSTAEKFPDRYGFTTRNT